MFMVRGSRILVSLIFDFFLLKRMTCSQQESGANTVPTIILTIDDLLQIIENVATNSASPQLPMPKSHLNVLSADSTLLITLP